MRDTLKLVLAVAGSAALVSGCGRKEVATTPAPLTDDRPQAMTPATTPMSAGMAQPPASLATGPQRSALEERIYFGFDQWSLSNQAQTALVAKADVLRSIPAITLRIEGHADERGSDEYNLALSNRRAAEAKRFLVQYGLEGSRLEVVGYGEEQPASTGHDEQAWSANRRAEFRLTTGADAR